jgi:hypothetical protein
LAVVDFQVLALQFIITYITVERYVSEFEHYTTPLTTNKCGAALSINVGMHFLIIMTYWYLELWAWHFSGLQNKWWNCNHTMNSIIILWCLSL